MESSLILLGQHFEPPGVPALVIQGLENPLADSMAEPVKLAPEKK